MWSIYLENINFLYFRNIVTSFKYIFEIGLHLFYQIDKAN